MALRGLNSFLNRLPAAAAAAAAALSVVTYYPNPLILAEIAGNKMAKPKELSDIVSD